MDTTFFRSHTSQVLRAEGRVQGLAECVLLNLTVRGVDVPGEVRERIESCEDRELLRVWHARAIRVERAEDIFGDESV